MFNQPTGVHDVPIERLTIRDKKVGLTFNSLIPKSVPAGTKNSHSEGFWLAKHMDTNIPTMMEPFSPPAAWSLWTSAHHPQEPLRKGFNEVLVSFSLGADFAFKLLFILV